MDTTSMAHRFATRSWLALALLALAATPALAHGPGDRHPGEGPDAATIWERMSEEFDANGDGVISREEYDREASRFPRLDSDGDGVLTAADVEAAHAARGTRRAGGLVVRLADGDRDRAVSAEEWRAFLAAVDPDGDGTFELEDLFALRGRERPERPHPGMRGERGAPGRLLDRDGDGVLETADLDAIFAELDRNADGALDADELPRHRGRGFRGPRGFGSG